LLISWGNFNLFALIYELAKTISADEVQTKSSHINLQIRGNLKFYFTTYFLVYSFSFFGWLSGVLNLFIRIFSASFGFCFISRAQIAVGTLYTSAFKHLFLNKMCKNSRCEEVFSTASAMVCMQPKAIRRLLISQVVKVSVRRRQFINNSFETQSLTSGARGTCLSTYLSSFPAAH